MAVNIEQINNEEQLLSVRSKINQNFNEVKERIEEINGWFDYNDTATATTPISVVANTDTYLTNNGLGVFTKKTYKPVGVPDIWDTTTNSFIFTDLENGDMLDIRPDITVTTSSINQEVNLSIELGYGSPGAYTLSIIRQQFKSVGTYNITSYYGIYMGDNTTRLNPGKLKVRSDANCNVRVNGWYVKILRKT